MSRSIPISLFPVAIVQDRYQGVYSNGDWLAIANADERQGEMARASWVLIFGPHGGDLEAGAFWATPPDWIRAGKSPDDAIANLMQDRS